MPVLPTVTTTVSRVKDMLLVEDVRSGDSFSYRHDAEIIASLDERKIYVGHREQFTAYSRKLRQNVSATVRVMDLMTRC